MTHLLRIALLTTILLPGQPSVSADPPGPASPPVRLETVERLTADEQDLVDYALQRYELAGIDLLDVQIEFRADGAECYGYGGVYLPGEMIVRICRPSERTMVHELAHAWLETTLNRADRQAFLQLRGLDTWTGGTQWDQRGAEQAAEVVTWGVMDENMLIRWLETSPGNPVSETWRLFKIPESHPDQLIRAYAELTGGVPQLRILDDPGTMDRQVTATTSPEVGREL